MYVHSRVSRGRVRSRARKPQQAFATESYILPYSVEARIPSLKVLFLSCMPQLRAVRSSAQGYVVMSS